MIRNDTINMKIQSVNTKGEIIDNYIYSDCKKSANMTIDN